MEYLLISTVLYLVPSLSAEREGGGGGGGGAAVAA